MNTMNINDAKQKLESELSSIEAELRSVGRLDPDNKIDWVPRADKMSTDSADRSEVADTFESLEENTAILADLELRYNSIKAALERIDAGRYGTCEVCKKEIETDRLRANPAATTCKEHMDGKK